MFVCVLTDRKHWGRVGGAWWVLVSVACSECSLWKRLNDKQLKEELNYITYVCVHKWHSVFTHTHTHTHTHGDQRTTFRS